MISKTVRKAIDATGCSIHSLAVVNGVSRTSLQEFYSGNQGVTLKTLEPICDYLGLELVQKVSRRQVVEQPTLFDNPPTATAKARKSDPVTSALAAERVEANGTAEDQRSRVLRFVQEHPGSTSAEIAKGLEMNRHQPARRLPELAKTEQIERGERRPCLVAGTLAVTWWPAKEAK